VVADRAKKKNRKNQKRKSWCSIVRTHPHKRGWAPLKHLEFWRRHGSKREEAWATHSGGRRRLSFGGTRSRIEAGGKTDKDGDGQSEENEPPGNSREFNGIEILPKEIKVCANVNRAPRSQPNSTKNAPIAPSHPLRQKKAAGTSESEAPRALRTPISRRRSRIAMTSVLTMPSVAMANASCQKCRRGDRKR